MADTETVELLLDEDGTIWIPEGDRAVGYHLHQGLRAQVLPHPDDLDAAVLHILGGPAAAPGFDEEGIAIELTAAGLRELAGQLLAAADQMDSDEAMPAAARGA